MGTSRSDNIRSGVSSNINLAVSERPILHIKTMLASVEKYKSEDSKEWNTFLTASKLRCMMQEGCDGNSRERLVVRPRLTTSWQAQFRAALALYTIVGGRGNLFFSFFFLGEPLTHVCSPGPRVHHW